MRNLLKNTIKYLYSLIKNIFTGSTMSFNEHGFLGNQINEIMSEIYNQNKDLFDYIIELNSFAQRFKFNLNSEPDELQKIVSVCAFIKFLNTFQSVFILAQRGLESDSKALLRIALEELFILKRLCVSTPIRICRFSPI